MSDAGPGGGIQALSPARDPPYIVPVTYRVQLKRLMDGQWYVRCNAAPNGVAEFVADSEEAALELMRQEIRYQLEWCPCSGVADDYVELEVNGTR